MRCSNIGPRGARNWFRVLDSPRQLLSPHHQDMLAIRRPASASWVLREAKQVAPTTRLAGHEPSKSRCAPPGSYAAPPAVLTSVVRERGMRVAAKPLRVLIGKVGLDGHDRGVKLVARALRDAGVEVIYTGLHQTPEQIVSTAIQEDVNAIGLSVLSGAHNYLFPRVLELLKEQGAEDIVLFGGGIIPDEDMPKLKAVGVRALFRPGTATDEVVKFVKGLRP